MAYEPEAHWTPGVRRAIGEIWLLADKLGADNAFALTRVAKEMVKDSVAISTPPRRMDNDGMLHYLDAIFLRLKTESSARRLKRRVPRNSQDV
jgi:hypothetical protein